ncbi:hypothetical protein HO173_010976 [Letharia columbiana]|uniref:Rad4-domain-containing protein n=1 Tax=Letharia columbiana TaxID=112416 RepID=A0A8H6FLQ5_9LECA|nr:uncharacterized protein HO173_010976 [Letharia columbiana]KAF6230860.1 hypothetical protein HO173_010976 [Letharia columbiana]
MARSAGAAKSKVAGKANARNAVPDVYGEMLVEAVSSTPARQSGYETPVKRRRVGGRIVTQSVDDNALQQSEQSVSTGNQRGIDDLFEEPNPNPQHIEQTESEDSADSDDNFEDVDLGSNIKQHDTSDHEMEEPGKLNLVLGGDNQKTLRSAQVRRKPITSTEKKLRLEIHKVHLCSLLAHVHLRNRWCNDESVHSVLKSMLAKRTISYLNPDESKSQFQRSRSFLDGLTQASDAFRADFKITARGMSKPVWADSPETLTLLQPPEDIDLPMQRSDFLTAAGKLKGSRDVGAQFFCAMLRAAGVDARLVCSMLPLPFQPAQKMALPQVMHNASRLPHHRSRQTTPEPDSEADAGSDGSLIVEGRAGSNRAEIRSRLGQVKRSASPEASSSRMSFQPKKANQKPIRESKYPVYWVEAFNEAVQKWVPIDPLVTKTIAKPSKFEPPAGDPGNNMSYVIAFEDDGSARDVTRRYAKAYNAKTRRERVEVTRDGEKWWRRVMRLYRRSHDMDRDQVEDAELTAKEAAEPMPRNVQDFKDHPYYALERHLKRHEVIHPKREVGKVGAGRPGTTNALEPIYRRRDVYQLKSADKWYRMGREIKHGEQPLKRVAVRRTKDSTLDPADMEMADDDNPGTALYAPHQTLLYVAPPVGNGQIPKNLYGNLDVYVPSMVPPGGTHIPHPETARAARIIGIDYADAVTGFSFKGRHGTAVTRGAVVAAEYREAVEEVIEAFEDERAQAEEERRSLTALKMWKRFLAGLRIRERIEGYDIEGERDTVMKYEMETVEDQDQDQDEGGGFLPDRDADEPAQPTARTMPTRNLPSLSNDGEGGGSCAAEDKQEEMEALHASDEDDDDGGGGGFQLDHDDQDAEEAIRKINEGDHEDTIGEETEKTAGHMYAENDGQEILDQGGGFLPNDDDTRDETPPTNYSITGGTLDNHSSIGARVSPQNSEHFAEAFPDLPARELEEAKTLQQLYESQGSEHLPVSKETVTAPGPSRLPDSPPMRERTGGVEWGTTVHPSEAYPSNELVAEKDSESDNSEEDKGSLLSHDPDDEDADPEWLA